MNHIVKRLLNLDELESGNMTLSWEEFDVTELLRGVMQASAVLAGDHTCEVTLDSPEELMVWADEFMPVSYTHLDVYKRQLCFLY